MRTRYKFFVGLMVVAAAPFLISGLGLEYVAVQKVFAGAGVSAMSYLVLGMSFSAIGALIPILAYRSARCGSRLDDLKETHPESPWLWRDDWSKQILRTGSEFPSGPILVASLWNLTLLGLTLLLYRQWFAEDDPFKWAVAVLPIVGVLLGFFAIKSILLWKRFGETRFVLGSLPVPAGDLVEGIAYTNIDIDDAPAHGFKVSLACISEKVRLDRMARSTRSFLLWRDELRFLGVNSIDESGKVVVPLYFRLPPNSAETTMQTNDRVTWKLKIEGATSRGLYSSSFTLPVFYGINTDDRMVDWTDCPAQLPASYAPQPVTKMPETVGYGIEVDATAEDSTAIHLARCRNRSLAILVSFVTVIWWVMTGFLYVRDASIELSVLCALGGLLAIYGSIVMLTFESLIHLKKGSIEVRKGPFGKGRIRKIETEEINTVSVEMGSRTGGGYLHNISVNLKDGSQRVVADLINDKRIADWLAFKIQTELFGISPSYPEVNSNSLRRDRIAKKRISNLNQSIGKRVSTIS